MIYPQSSQSTAWEYKIVRAERGEFAQPAYLNALLREEAQSGWMLDEVYDDSKVRLMRPLTARRKDAFLPQGINPYRISYAAPEINANISQALFLAICVIMALGLLVAVAIAAAWLIAP